MNVIDKKSCGVIYILTNPSFPDYVKIGFASNIEKRLKQLNCSESIPYAFRVYAIYEVKEKLTDIELHKLIDTLNPSLRAIETFDGKKRTKEFYAMSKEDAYSLLECIAKISGTEEKLKKMQPEGHEIEDEQTANEIKTNNRRLPWTFSQYGIPIGSILTCIYDDTRTVKIVDEKKVEYQGITMSLSKAAEYVLEGYRNSPPYQGPAYFKYNGKTLTDIRSEIELNS